MLSACDDCIVVETTDDRLRKVRYFLWVIGNSPSTDDGIVGVDVQIQ